MPRNVPANPQKTEPELRDLSRWLLRLICGAAALLSAFIAGHGVLMTLQILNDAIPAGRIEAVLGQTKTGMRLRLDGGREVVFSNLALFRRTKPVVLAVGNRVEKQYGSCVYLVNGTKLTDLSWVVREFLLPPLVFVPLGIYVLLGSAFVLAYGRTPWGDSIWRDADPNRPHWPRTRGGLLAALIAGWLLVLVLIIVFFTVVQGCLFVIFGAVVAMPAD